MEVIIKMKTVFIIGAGANKEIGMPTGDELKNTISQIMDEEKGSILKQFLKEQKNYVKFCGRNYYIDPDYLISMRDAMPLVSSIDNYISQLNKENNKGIEILGKLAIIISILKSEKKAKENVFTDLKSLDKSWYPLFFQKITEHSNLEGLIKKLNDLSFIIFNYDRCFELFFFKSLMLVYKLNEKDAAEIVKRMAIYHPYGTIGTIPFQNGNKTIDFGDINALDAKKLLSVLHEIKTFDESCGGPIGTSIKKACIFAKKTVFLGFAYHRQNIDLLYPESIPVYEDRIEPYKKYNIPIDVEKYGTALEISEYDKNKINENLYNHDKRVKQTILLDNDCYHFFKNLSYTLFGD
jgi:hypothetical protein